MMGETKILKYCCVCGLQIQKKCAVWPTTLPRGRGRETKRKLGKHLHRDDVRCARGRLVCGCAWERACDKRSREINGERELHFFNHQHQSTRVPHFHPNAVRNPHTTEQQREITSMGQVMVVETEPASPPATKLFLPLDRSFAGCWLSPLT